MKERVIKVGILSVVFVLAIIVSSYWMNRGNAGMTADMDAAVLPTISFETVGKEANLLVGHKREMSVATMRDTIAVYDETDTLTARIHHNEEEIDQFKYEIYTLDGTEKLYEETIDEVQDTLSLNMGNALKKNQEGLLKITLSQDGSSIYYYTRVIKDHDYHVKECVEYAENLHNNMLQKQNENEVKAVMESNSEGDNTTLQHVTIHSDLEHVMWGDLHPEVVNERKFEIKEAKAAYTSVQLTYQVKCAGDNNEKEIYNVKEFFKVAYSSGEMYLLEYDRTMQEVFDTSNIVLSSKGVILGIADANTRYKVNQDGTVVAFIQANELWSYSKEDDAFALVFSFAESEKEDERNYTDQHSIQILSMEENGDMTFSVSGYMNRGTHEGESGIAVYYYNLSQNCIEEKAFIPSVESHLVIEEELNEMAYYNRDQEVLYIVVNGTLLQIDIEDDVRTALVEGLQKGQYAASDDGHLFAYQKTEEGKIVTEIWNFAENSRQNISVEADEIVVPLGFVGDDFVYGLLFEENVGHDTFGNPIQAMHRLEIRNAEHEVVKTYQQTAVYILGVSIENNMITLTQGVKNGSSYKVISENYITNNETSDKGVVLKSYWTDLKGTQYRLEFSDGIKDKSAKTLKPKYVLQEIPTVIELEGEIRGEYFYVYGLGEQAGVFEEAGEAIQLADEISGVVISSNQNYVWEDGNRVAWYRNFEISGFVANAGESTLVACMRKVLSYEGKKGDAVRELATKSAEQILSEQLGKEAIRFRNCSAEDMRYLMDKGVPIIAMKDSTSAILLIGYDARTVTYIDPTNGGVYSATFEKMNGMLEGSGNTFIGYLS